VRPALGGLGALRRATLLGPLTVLGMACAADTVGTSDGLTAADAEEVAAEAVDLTITGVGGPMEPVALQVGALADLGLLTEDERHVIAEADARAATLRTRPLSVRAPAGTTVRLEQVRHHFPLGVTQDLRKFESAADLEWYRDLTTSTFNFVVVENELKWRVIEAVEGTRDYTLPDATVAWAEDNGLAVKGHVLVWGNGPPLSSTGVPDWLLARHPETPLADDEREALSETLRAHVRDAVDHYGARVATWDVTNELLQPFAPWFVLRLGGAVAEDAFAWADEAAPAATLVMNEWTSEVFTGLGGPDAATLRDRCIEFVAAGAPIDALGIQAQFVPGIVTIGQPADLSGRISLVDYAAVLDTLAACGLPLHVTEVNVIAPDAPALRAAQMEGLMRLWWGHPAVEAIGFWSLWNRVSGKRSFGPGLWDDDKQLTPHGAAVYALLNDVWRTRATATIDASGRLDLRAHPGIYRVAWSRGGETRTGELDLPLGSAGFVIALTEP